MREIVQATQNHRNWTPKSREDKSALFLFSGHLQEPKWEYSKKKKKKKKEEEGIQNKKVDWVTKKKKKTLSAWTKNYSHLYNN